MPLEEPDETRRLRALSHPVRLRILSMVTGGPMSASELARELDMSQAAVSYHVRQLDAAGMLELAEVRHVRGGRELRYRYRAGQPTLDTAGAALPAAAVTSEVERRVRSAGNPSWTVFSDLECWVDQETWVQVARMIGDAMQVLHDQALPEPTRGTIHVSATALLVDLDGKVKPRPRRKTTSTARKH